jgi:hypothetical protein
MFYQKPGGMSNKTRGLHLEDTHEKGNMPFSRQLLVTDATMGKNGSR